MKLGHGDDEGSVAIFVAAVTPGLILAFGMVADLGAHLRAARNATDVAQEAARAGASSIDASLYRSGGAPVIAPALAVKAADAYLTSAGYTGSASMVGPNTIKVSVTITQGSPVLARIGVGPFSVTETATADLRRGISEEG